LILKNHRLAAKQGRPVKRDLAGWEFEKELEKGNLAWLGWVLKYFPEVFKFEPLPDVDLSDEMEIDPK
jgi:hypothetical protein